jgi:hypothetical protein
VYRADDSMRTVKFGLMDRLILTPMELNLIIRKLPVSSFYYGIFPASPPREFSFERL